MKKALLIIAAVAILGLVGISSRSQKNTGLGLSRSISQQSSATQSSAASSSSSNSGTSTAGSYKNGTFKGAAEDTPYGTVQIAVVINGGKITDVSFLQMPSDMGHSVEITQASEPLLKQTTLQVQSSNIDFVSGATSTSYGYQASLQAALDQARVS